MRDKKDIEIEKRLSDTMLDRGTPTVISGNTYEIKSLKMYTRWLISECINEMEIAENETINIIESMFSDIPLLVKILTIAILRDREKIEDKELFNKTYDELMECDNMQEYLNALKLIIQKMEIEWFFFTQETAKGINILPSKAGYLQKSKETMDERGYSMQQANLVTLQE